MKPIDRIRRGLQEMEETGSAWTAAMSKSPRLAAMVGLDVSLTGVREHRRKAKNLKNEIMKLHFDLGVEDAAKTARITREHDELGWMPDEKGRGRIDHLGATKRMQLRDAALSKMRKVVEATVAEKVEPLRVKVRELEATRGYLREAWSTPLVYINRMTLLSQDRATAQAVLSGAGAYTLNLAASEAMRKGYLALAMAVCAATENLNKEQSGLMRYTREEIAASVGFKDFFDATEALEMTGLELATAELDGRELVGVTVRSEERMALGRRKEQTAKSLGKSIEELEGKTDAG